jgi:hypothetical protein
VQKLKLVYVQDVGYIQIKINKKKIKQTQAKYDIAISCACIVAWHSSLLQ